MNQDELAAYLESGSPGDLGAGDQAERLAAQRLREALADDATWAEPSPGGVEALLRTIEAEKAGSAASEEAPWPPPRHLRSPSRARFRGRPAILAAAAAVVLVALGVGALLLRADEERGREFDIAGTELAPDASAVATVEELGSGVAIELDVSDLPPAPPGTYYQAWVKGDDGLVTVGTFHMREGDDVVELWAGVDLDRYPTLTVTLQQEGAGQESSGEVVLTGEIHP